jgi:hypothetical protein
VEARLALVFVPLGSAAQLSDPGALRSSFTADLAGDHVAQLIVNDGFADSAPDLVVINAKTKGPSRVETNARPTAEAGPDQALLTSALMQLDGALSSDPDGDAMTYEWALTAKPAGSTAQLSDPAAVNPIFTPDLSGDYLVQLIVNDLQFDSLPDTLVVTLNPPPRPTPAPTGRFPPAAWSPSTAARRPTPTATP